jgi:hypothetical protein
MCGGEIADVAADVIWKMLIGSAQVKVKSRHVRGSSQSMMLNSAPKVTSADRFCA